MSTGGWDGIVEAKAPSVFVPAGVPGWELSVNASPTKKADDDYAKRLRDDGTATYIAVSLRPWPKRRAWAKERLAEGHWAAVRAYGLDDVEMWFEAAPITHAWISNLLGKAPYGYLTAEVWMENWHAMTNPALPIDVHLAGRSDAQTSLAERLAMMSGTTTVRGPSIPEVMAFIVAVGYAVESGGKHGIVSRMAFVDTPEAWRSLVAQSTPLILIPGDEGLVDEIPAQSHHHYIVPVSGARADIKVPNLDSAAVTTTLTSLGLDPVRASNLGHLARRSLLTMRRQIALKPGLKHPPWGKPPVGQAAGALRWLAAGMRLTNAIGTLCLTWSA